MKSNWIHNRTFDLHWIILPPFYVLLLVLIFNQQIEQIQDQFSFHSWLLIIVFVDVAHVYASLFRTYLSPEKRKEHQKLLLFVPLTCLIVSILLFSMGETVFWSALAYIAVFHFIRQQYGFMRLYASNESKKWIDTISIYNATIFPMTFWFSNPDRSFTWFVENEFFTINFNYLREISKALYVIIIAIYLIQSIFFIIQTKKINYQKHLIIIGTYLSWFFGIVYFNNELIFTLLNVISHGIPYMALVFAKDFNPKKMENSSKRNLLKPVLVFLVILLTLALTEELLWENLIWKEHFTGFGLTLSPLIAVPILALPQFTHYILDAFIWRRNY